MDTTLAGLSGRYYLVIAGNGAPQKYSYVQFELENGNSKAPYTSPALTAEPDSVTVSQTYSFTAQDAVAAEQTVTFANTDEAEHTVALTFGAPEQTEFEIAAVSHTASEGTEKGTYTSEALPENYTLAAGDRLVVTVRAVPAAADTAAQNANPTLQPYTGKLSAADTTDSTIKASANLMLQIAPVELAGKTPVVDRKTISSIKLKPIEGLENMSIKNVYPDTVDPADYLPEVTYWYIDKNEYREPTETEKTIPGMIQAVRAEKEEAWSGTEGQMDADLAKVCGFVKSNADGSAELKGLADSSVSYYIYAEYSLPAMSEPTPGNQTPPDGGWKWFNYSGGVTEATVASTLQNYETSATPESLDFGSVTYYADRLPGSKEITVTNSGAKTTQITEVVVSELTRDGAACPDEVLALTPETGSMAAAGVGASAVTVQPVAGLGVGVYSAKVKITVKPVDETDAADGTKTMVHEVPVTITVTAKKLDAPTALDDVVSASTSATATLRTENLPVGAGQVEWKMTGGETWGNGEIPLTAGETVSYDFRYAPDESGNYTASNAASFEVTAPVDGDLAFSAAPTWKTVEYGYGVQTGKTVTVTNSGDVDKTFWLKLEDTDSAFTIAVNDTEVTFDADGRSGPYALAPGKSLSIEATPVTALGAKNGSYTATLSALVKPGDDYLPEGNTAALAFQVVKAQLDAPKKVGDVVTAVTHETITLRAADLPANVGKVQVSTDHGATWQDKAAFEANKLTASTDYDYLFRYYPDDDANYAPSEGVSFRTTTKADIGVTQGEVPTWPNVSFGYSAQEAKDLTYTNANAERDLEVTFSISGDTSAFTLKQGETEYAGAQVTLAKNGGTASLTIQPVQGLEAGTYNLKIIVVDALSGDQGSEANLSFKVLPQKLGAPETPELDGTPTYDSITVKAFEGVPPTGAGRLQYSIDDGATWQDGLTFTDLKPEKEYSVVARYVADDSGNYADSDKSADMKATTAASPYKITLGEAVDFGSLSYGYKDVAAKTITVTNGSTAQDVKLVLSGADADQFVVSADGTLIPTGTDGVTIAGVTAAGSITVSIVPKSGLAVRDTAYQVKLTASSENYTAGAESSASLKVVKAKLAAPATEQDVVSGKSSNSITIKTESLPENVSAIQWSTDGTTWNTTNPITGLTAETDITYSYRYVSGSESYADSDARSITVRTLKAGNLALDAAPSWPTVTWGYGAQAAHSVELRNSGAESATGTLTLKDSADAVGAATSKYFDVYLESGVPLSAENQSITLGGGKKATISIQPKTGLDAGTYTTTLDIGSSSITVTFQVKKAKLDAPTVLDDVVSIVSDTTITVKTESLPANVGGVEWAVSADGPWSSANPITGRTPETEYTYYFRFVPKEAKNLEPSDGKNFAITMNKTGEASITAAPNWNLTYGDMPEAKDLKLKATAAVNATVELSGDLDKFILPEGFSAASASKDYTLTAEAETALSFTPKADLDAGTYTVSVTLKAGGQQVGTANIQAAVTAKKLEAPVISADDLTPGVTSITVTNLPVLPGGAAVVQYSIDNGVTWSVPSEGKVIFDGLERGKTYHIVAQHVADDSGNYLDSDSSTAADKDTSTAGTYDFKVAPDTLTLADISYGETSDAAESVITNLSDVAVEFQFELVGDGTEEAERAVNAAAFSATIKNGVGVGVNGEAVLSVQSVDGLTAGNYSATVNIYAVDRDPSYGSNGAHVKANGVELVRTVKVSVTVSAQKLAAPDAEADVVSAKDKNSITLRTGNLPEGAASIAVALNADGSSAAPLTELSAGTVYNYYYKYVSNDNGKYGDSDWAKISVRTADEIDFTVNAWTDWAAAEYGYADQAVKTITVTNTGTVTQDLDIQLAGADLESFVVVIDGEETAAAEVEGVPTISQTVSVEVSGTVDVTIRPKTGLDARDTAYSFALTTSTGADSTLKQGPSINGSFKVYPKPLTAPAALDDVKGSVTCDNFTPKSSGLPTHAKNVEWSQDGKGGWQSGDITPLTAGTEYSYYFRYTSEGGNYANSPASAEIKFTTLEKGDVVIGTAPAWDAVYWGYAREHAAAKTLTITNDGNAARSLTISFTGDTTAFTSTLISGGAAVTGDTYLLPVGKTLNIGLTPALEQEIGTHSMTINVKENGEEVGTAQVSLTVNKIVVNSLTTFGDATGIKANDANNADAESLKTYATGSQTKGTLNLTGHTATVSAAITGWDLGEGVTYKRTGGNYTYYGAWSLDDDHYAFAENLDAADKLFRRKVTVKPIKLMVQDATVLLAKSDTAYTLPTNPSYTGGTDDAEVSGTYSYSVKWDQAKQDVSAYGRYKNSGDVTVTGADDWLTVPRMNTYVEVAQADIAIERVEQTASQAVMTVGVNYATIREGKLELTLPDGYCLYNGKAADETDRKVTGVANLAALENTDILTELLPDVFEVTSFSYSGNKLTIGTQTITPEATLENPTPVQPAYTLVGADGSVGVLKLNLALTRTITEGDAYPGTLLLKESTGNTLTLGSLGSRVDLGKDVALTLGSYDPKKAVSVTLSTGEGADAVSFTLDRPVLELWTSKGKDQPGWTGNAMGTGYYAQEMTVTHLTPGVYTMTISKPGHADVVLENLVIRAEDSKIDLAGRLPEGVAQVLRMTAGDLTGDGSVRMDDYSAIMQLSAFGKKAETDPANALYPYDLDGDGYIRMSDMDLVSDPANMGHGKLVITLKDPET